MAVTKLAYLDKVGVKTLAEEILKGANTKIQAVIIEAVDDGSYTETKKALSAKAILDLVGKKGEESETTAFGLIQKLTTSIGAATDNAEGTESDGLSVYGYVNKTKKELKDLISALTDLKYQVLDEGAVSAENPTTRNTNVLYLQHDDESDKSYEIWIWTGSNGSTGAYYVDGGTTPDATEGDTEDKWICIGDTSLDLVGYWQKTDENVTALQQEILESISEADIKAQVSAALSEVGDQTLDVSP